MRFKWVNSLVMAGIQVAVVVRGDAASNLPHRQACYAYGMTPIRLLIVADDPLARAGIAYLLADAPGCRIVAQTHGSEAPHVLDSVEPDAVVWDVGWNVADDLPDWSDTAVPIIALLTDETGVTAVWAAGVNALLHRQVSGDKLATAAKTAVHGLIILDPALTQSLMIAPSPASSLADELTPREMDVLQLLAEGMTNRAIAQRLAISDHTVKFHVNAIMGKLGAQSRTEAVVRATRLGLILL